MAYKDKEKKREHQKEYRALHKQEYNDYKKKWRRTHKRIGLCKDCNREVLSPSVLCARHLWLKRLSDRRYHIRNKIEELKKMNEKYNRLKQENKCPRCGIPLIEGEGVLCVNCNWATHHTGYKGVLYEVNYEKTAIKP